MSHIATIQNVYAAFGRGDLPAILEVVADDCVWDLSRPRVKGASRVPWIRRFNGKKEVPEFFGALGSTLDVKVFSPEEFYGEGDRVAVKVHEEYVVRANGRPLIMDTMHLFTFDSR